MGGGCVLLTNHLHGNHILNFKTLLLLCGLAGMLYLLWPFITLVIKVYIYRLIIDYGFYFLLLFAGVGFYFWRRLKS